jgi:HlyD family secretion protein
VSAKTRYVVIAVVMVAAAVGFFVVRGNGKSAEPKWTTSKVEKGKLTARVTATGTLSALVTVQVGSQVSGRISEILVDFNSPVKKGQVIARIDPQLFAAAVEQARANHLAASANLTKAKVQAAEADRLHTRQKALRAEKLISQADLDTAQAGAESARAAVDAAQSAVEQSRAAMHQAQINFNYCTISSPISGVVISRSVDVGQTVAASLAAPTLFTIAEDLQKMQVDTSVAEADVGKLKAGMNAVFTVDAYPSERFRGTVRQIRNAPQTVQNVVTYDAVIDVANPDLKLKPGMTATVTFVYAEREDALLVPNAAMRFRPPQTAMSPADGGARPPRPKRGDTTPDQRQVYILKDGKPEMVSIRVGVTDGTRSEVVEGPLQVGDLVITDVQTDGPKPPSQTNFPRRGF